MFPVSGRGGSQAGHCHKAGSCRPQKAHGSLLVKSLPNLICCLLSDRQSPQYELKEPPTVIAEFGKSYLRGDEPLPPVKNSTVPHFLKETNTFGRSRLMCHMAKTGVAWKVSIYQAGKWAPGLGNTGAWGSVYISLTGVDHMFVPMSRSAVLLLPSLLNQGSASASDIWGRLFPGGVCHVHCKMFCRAPGLYPLDASGSTWNRNVSRHCQVFPRGKLPPGGNPLP